MRDRTLAQYTDILRRDFAAFNQRAFRELNGSTPWLGNWHLEVLAAKLEAVRRRACNRLLVTLPPRHLKSHTVSVAFVAWLLGHEPALQILCASYAHDLSDKLARDCRALMLSPFFCALFETRLAPDRQAVGEFATTAGGGRFSTSVGGVVTGRGADIIVIDDPLKADDAFSDARRGAVNEWFDNALYSRLNDKAKGAIVIAMQRLHENDLVGHACEKEAFDAVCFPALARADESFSVDTPYGPQTFARAKDDVLHPARESRATLERLRERTGSAAFMAQCQQAPAAREGVFVKTQWFPRYAPEQLKPGFDYYILSCDTASKISEISDYSVCTPWGARDGDLWLLDVMRRRLEYPELKRAILEMARRQPMTTVVIEDRASGIQLVQELRREEGDFGVHAAQPVGDEKMRLWAQTAMMEAGRVRLPQSAPWLDAYLAELAAFPNGRHDDQVDSTSQALDYEQNPPGEQGWFRYAAAEVRRKGL